MIGMGGKAFQESRSSSTENEGQKERLQSAIACSGAVPMKGQEQGYRGKKSGIARVSSEMSRRASEGRTSQEELKIGKNNSNDIARERGAALE